MGCLPGQMNWCKHAVKGQWWCGDESEVGVTCRPSHDLGRGFLNTKRMRPSVLGFLGSQWDGEGEVADG